MNDLQIFESPEFGEVRTVEIDEKIYFMGSDIARALGYQRTNDAVKQHCRATVKYSTPISGKMQEVNFIPEGDVYRLIVRSQLPAAEKFESWVFDDVLPQIRQTGIYADMSTELRAIIMQDKKLQTVVTHMEEHESRIGNLEDTMTVDYGQQKELNDLHHSRGALVLGGKNSAAYHSQNIRQRVYREIWKDYKDYFEVATYKDTPVSRYDEAKEYLRNWEPSMNLRMEIANAREELSA